MHTYQSGDDFGDAPAITCPSCGFDYTLHVGTTIYNRELGEDGPLRKITVDGFGDITNRPSEGSPSPRRDAIVLHFTCEAGCRFDLEFIQHKGNTFLVHSAHAPEDAT